MRITKYGHACVRLSQGDASLVLDPGAFTHPEAVDDATAVLITHEHADHWTPDMLRRTSAPVFTIQAVADAIHEQAPDLSERVTVVAPGESFDPGIPTTAVGEKHAVIHPELPHFDNSGYLVQGEARSAFHPGDALTLPGREVDVLLLPVSAPWLKASEAIDYARDVGAPVSLGIHGAIYSELGHGFMRDHLERFLGERDQRYVRVQPGQDLE